MRKSLHILCLPLLFALLAIGCEEAPKQPSEYNFDTGGLPPIDTSGVVDTSGSGDTAVAPDTTAPCDIDALFERNGCTTSGCHGDAYRSTPPLVGKDFESRLVSQRSLRPDCHADIIDADDPSQSLILRLTDPARYDAATACGSPMPPYGAAMSPDDVACLEGWVRQLATTSAEGSAEGSAAPFEAATIESAVGKAKALLNGRCKLHGGMSTGPKTLLGRQIVGAATKARMSNFQLQLAKDGFQRWLDAGGRQHLSRPAKKRHGPIKATLGAE